MSILYQCLIKHLNDKLEIKTMRTPITFAQWEAIATQAQTANAIAKQTGDAKKGTFAELANVSLQAFLQMDVKLELAIVNAVSKEGSFQALRGALSASRYIANEAIEHGMIKTSKESFTLAQLQECETFPFAIATVYKELLAAKKEKPAAKSDSFSDDDAIALYAKNSGQQVADLKKSAFLKKDAIAQGHVMHQEQSKANAIAYVGDTIQSVKDAMAEVASVDQEKAVALIYDLLALYSPESLGEEFTTKVEMAA